MKVSLDTNIWIFGLAEIDPYCERILLNLRRFDVLVPNQIRAELERNLSGFDMKSFYQILNGLEVEVDFAKIPFNYISMFEQKGRCPNRSVLRMAKD